MNLLRAIFYLVSGPPEMPGFVLAVRLFIACFLAVVAGCILSLIPRKPRLIILALAALVFVGLVIQSYTSHAYRSRPVVSGGDSQSYASHAYRPRPLVFDGDSTKLTRTLVVPTLDTPIKPGKNVIWCASFQAAWKSLQNDVVKEPVQLADVADICARLNDSAIPEVPDGALYAAAGRVREGIVDTIQREQAQRFPGSTRPDFPKAAEDDLIAYGYLESSFKFPIPYSDATSPVTFTDSAGNKTPIRTFGVRKDDDPVLRTVRKQIEVLVRPGDVKDRPDDFVVDLCRDSKDTQIVLASVPAAPSLKEALAAVDSDIAFPRPFGDSQNRLYGGEPVLVPELAYRITHRFSPLMGRSFLNAAFADLFVIDAQQDTLFRLDRSGMELRSRADLEATKSAKSRARAMIADRPFLIYLKKRGAALPYFAMWVDNDELLMKW